MKNLGIGFFLILAVCLFNCKQEEPTSIPEKTIERKQVKSVNDSLKIKNMEELESQILDHVSKIDGISEEQLERIHQIRKTIGKISFTSKDEMIKYRKLYVKKLKWEILTKDQVKQYATMRKEQGNN